MSAMSFGAISEMHIYRFVDTLSERVGVCLSNTTHIGG